VQRNRLPREITSPKEHIFRMPEGQKAIYNIMGEFIKAIEKCPFLEVFGEARLRGPIHGGPDRRGRDPAAEGL
jgi:hypothetical protein